jgi:phosphatidylserine/phosphatidylglycerophosphate/cardiolipin synthase-like enzyme
MFKTLLSLSALFLLVSCSGDQPPQTVKATPDFCSSIHRNDSLSITEALKPIEEQMKNKTGVFVLEEGGTSMITRAWLSEYAEKKIDIQYFIFSTDNVGLIALDYIVRAADRGVKVRILLDDIMVEAKAHDLLVLDAHENIEVKIYNPGVNLGKNLIDKYTILANDFRGANQRMHNKTFTVDDKVVITGGRNIADEYFDYDHEYNFRDRDVLILGKAVGQVEQSFELFWNHSLSVAVTEVVTTKDTIITGHCFDRLHQYACDTLNFWPQVRDRIQQLPQAFSAIQQSGGLVWLDSVRFVSDFPGKNDGSKQLEGGGMTTFELMKLVAEAKTSVDIQSPYLITTELGQKLFRGAVKRGVRVRILTNSLASTDNLEAFGGYQKCRNALLETGIRIFEFRPDAPVRYKVMASALQKKLSYAPIFGLHAKSMVVDGKTTVIGTFNLDPRSANLNTECFAVIYSEQIAQGVLKGMEEEFKPENAWETTKTYNPDALAGKQKNTDLIHKKLIPKEIL